MITREKAIKYTKKLLRYCSGTECNRCPFWSVKNNKPCVGEALANTKGIGEEEQ
jgi:hypothetical protein